MREDLTGLLDWQDTHEVAQQALLADPSDLVALIRQARAVRYTRRRSILLLAALSISDVGQFKTIAYEILTNLNDVLDFGKIILMEQLRLNFGSAPKKVLAHLLNTLPPHQFVKYHERFNPSLTDLIRLTHPKPYSPERSAIFRWLLGLSFDKLILPSSIKNYINLNSSNDGPDATINITMNGLVERSRYEDGSESQNASLVGWPDG